jgi:rod shape-determining protein MreC
MKSSLIEGQALTLRAVVFVVISIILMIVDHRLTYLDTVRTYFLALVYPIQYLVDLPVKTGQWLTVSVSSRRQLLEENARLRAENMRLRVTMQKFQALKNEKERLRSLLDASKKVDEQVQVAEILAVDLEPSKRKIVINKGKNEGVFINQPVIDGNGVMGQVIHVGFFSSTVMLITDPAHELPVQVVRTGLRTVAKGMGTVNRLSLLYIANVGLNMKIKKGDLIVTSGFGQKFPQGYPVGTVIEVIPDIGKPYAQVQALPRAALEHNREVLLLRKKVP